MNSRGRESRSLKWIPAGTREVLTSPIKQQQQQLALGLKMSVALETRSGAWNARWK